MTLRTGIALATCAVFLAGFQIRHAVATWEARNTFLFVPFQLQPCSNIIEHPAQYRGRDGLLEHDELLAVNGRSFTGATIYRQELRRAVRYLDAVRQLPPKDGGEALSHWPFRVTVHSNQGGTRSLNVYFGNCTCGSLSHAQVTWYCLLPPWLCLLVGLAVVARKPEWTASWLLLAVMICVSQLDIAPEWSSQWSQTADPMEWADWFRVPALAYQTFFKASWPAWLLLFAVHCFGRSRSTSVAWLAAAPTLLLAALKTSATVGSSECFRVAAPLYHQLETFSFELSVVGFAGLALVTWNFGKIWRLVTATLALIAVGVISWPPPLASIERFYDVPWPVVPVNYRTPDLVGTFFTASVLLAIMIAGWRIPQCPVWMEKVRSGLFFKSSVALIAVPFLYVAVSKVYPLWWTPRVPQISMAAAGLGLVASAVIVWWLPSHPRNQFASARSSGRNGNADETR